MAFESTFKAIDNTLHHDDGCSTALDYVEQSSWVLFLKYFDDLEKTREQAAELEEKTYERIISGDYQWNQWAMPLDMKGNYDVKKAMVGDDLIDFVNQKLFPYLQDFTQKYEPDTIEYKVGIIFTNIKNKISSGYNLRDVIERIDELKFQTAENRHEMTQIYEDRLRQMGNAGRNGGEYYTPRPLIKTIVKSVNPKIGETVYDGACGSAGFLCEAYSYMHDKVTTQPILQRRMICENFATIFQSSASCLILNLKPCCPRRSPLLRRTAGIRIGRCMWQISKSGRSL